MKLTNTLPNAAGFRSRRGRLAATISELALPLLRLATTGQPAPRPPGRWRTGLLVGANHIGDLLYRSASLDLLHEGLPDCRWDILAPDPAGQILGTHPCIRKVHAFEIPSSARTREFGVLRLESYDVAVGYDTGSYLPALQLAVSLKIPNRVFYAHKGFSGLITRRIPIHAPQPFPAYFRDLVTDITGFVSRAPLRPSVLLTEEDHAEAGRFMKTNKLEPGETLLACFVTTRQPMGAWPKDNYAQTLRIVESGLPGVRTLLMGSEQDKHVLNDLKQKHGLRAIICAGRLSLRGLVAFLSFCRAVLTTDSGPRHLANAAGTPPVFFRNLWFNPVEAGVYLPWETDFAPADVGCLPPQKQGPYFNSVRPESVARLLEQKLQP